MRQLIAALMITVIAPAIDAGEWTRFRGPNGSGIAADTSVPVRWSETENLLWKTPLPGPGTSSAIVSGGRVYLTSWSGYGDDPLSEDTGRMEDLKRHLLCVDRADGTIVWNSTVDAVMPEDRFDGYLREHGYATNTPVTDGNRIYVFFGKTGALAFDLNGKQLWHVNLGTESTGRRWGSGASPVVYGDLLIVNASDESQTIYALDCSTGKEVWKAEASSLDLVFNTPILIDLPNGRTELILAVPGGRGASSPGEIWGLNPDSGKLIWLAKAELPGNTAPSIVSDGDIMFCLGGRNGGSFAVRAGGRGDVTDSHVLWTGRAASYVPSPVYHDGYLYWVSDQGVFHCVDARDGSIVSRGRLIDGGGSGRGGRPFYASMVLAADRLYAVSRRAGTYVIAARPDFEQLEQNIFESDTSDFNATPAVSDERMYLRSNEFLYCVAETSASHQAR